MPVPALLLAGAGAEAGELTRLPRARPEPRVAPKEVPQSAAGAAGALAVSAGAPEGVLPDVDVSDMSLFVCGLNRAHRVGRELRGCAGCGVQKRSTGATRAESRSICLFGQLLILESPCYVNEEWLSD